MHFPDRRRSSGSRHCGQSRHRAWTSGSGVEVRSRVGVYGNPRPRPQSIQASRRRGRGDVPVPGARPCRLAGADRSDPGAKLLPVGVLEPAAPIRVEAESVPALLADRDRRIRRERDRATLAHEFCPDVVAILRVEEGLDVHHSAALRFQYRELRLARRRVARGAGADHRGGGEIVVEQIAGHIDVVDGRVGDDELGGHVMRRHRIAVHAMQEERGAQRAVRDAPPHRAVAGIEAAHVANLDEAPAAADLGGDDGQALLQRVGKRLLAQDGFPLLQAGDHERSMRLVRRGNDDGFDGGIGDEPGSGVEHAARTAVAGHPLGAFAVGVLDRHEFGAGDAVVQDAGVVGSHDPRPDDTYFDAHQPCPSLTARSEIIATNRSGERALSFCFAGQLCRRAAASIVDGAQTADPIRKEDCKTAATSTKIANRERD